MLARTSSGDGPVELIPMSQFVASPAFVQSQINKQAMTVGSAAGGDLTGTYPNPTVAKIRGNAVITGIPVDGYNMRWVNANSDWEYKPPYGQVIVDGTDTYVAVVASLADPELAFSGGKPVYAKNPGISASLVRGVTDGSDAPAGFVGERLFASVSSLSPVALTNNIVSNLTSITLTPGDWDVRGEVLFSAGGATTTSFCAGAFNTTSATFPLPGQGSSFQLGSSQGAGIDSFFGLAPFRFNVTTNTQIFLMAEAGFASGALSAYGFIEARRMR